MSRVITFSRVFPSYHPRKGEQTFFVEKILNSVYKPKSIHDIPIEVQNIINTMVLLDKEEKYHTIRAGNRWKVGDKFSPRIWSGKPYQSKQIIIAPDIEIKKIWDYEVKIINSGIEQWVLNGTQVSESNEYMQHWFNAFLIEKIANNDGLALNDFLNWFKHPKPFTGQIICWNETIEY